MSVAESKEQTILITGISGQDGYYIAEQLLEAGPVRIIGLVMSREVERPMIGERLWSQIETIEGDLTDAGLFERLVCDIKPDKVFHLAALSHVGQSIKDPAPTMEVTGYAPVRLLEAVRKYSPATRIFFPTTAEMFGRTEISPQDENVPLAPVSPYGVAKTLVFCAARCWRENYGLFVSNGILFNHESPRRGENFVTRKISLAAAKIARGLQDKVGLGNLDSRRDWGWAPDYAKGMRMIMDYEKPDDFVLATGVNHSVRDFCRTAFGCLGLNWEDYVYVDQAFVRPNEPTQPVGSPEKARRLLGWTNETPFESMVEQMVRFDYDRLKV